MNEEELCTYTGRNQKRNIYVENGRKKTIFSIVLLFVNFSFRLEVSCQHRYVFMIDF